MSVHQALVNFTGAAVEMDEPIRRIIRRGPSPSMYCQRGFFQERICSKRDQAWAASPKLPRCASPLEREAGVTEVIGSLD